MSEPLLPGAMGLAQLKKREEQLRRESFPYAYKDEADELKDRIEKLGFPVSRSTKITGVDMTLDIFENKNLVFQMVLLAGMLKLARMPGGMRTIQVLGKATIDGIFRTTNSLGKASAANYIAAWANPVLISGIMERFGFLPPRFNRGYHDAISKLTGLNVATGIVELIFGKSPMEGAFPSSLDFGTEGAEPVAGAMGREVAAAEMAGAGAGAGAAAGAVPIV